MFTYLKYKTNRNEFITLTSIAAFALLVRIILIIHLNSYDISIENNHWSFGFEIGRVARSITNGDGFSSPFEIGNLPTAWVAPVYPYILALVFKVFGIYSQSSAFTILFLNSVFSSLTCVFIYYIAKTVINERAGLLSSIIFAIYPPALWHSINTVWNTTLSTLLIAILVFYAVISLKKLNHRRSIVCGTIMGITVLANPGIMAFYPFYLFWLYSKRKNSVQNVSTYIAVMIVSFLVIISPWVIRNYLVFDKFIPVKSNLGMELRLGNNPNADGTFTMREGVSLHPTFSKKEMTLFKELKETGYVEYSSGEAWDYIFKNPLKVVLLTVKRFYLFWFGYFQEEDNWKGNIQGVENLSVLKRVSYFLPVPLLIFGIVMAWRNRKDISIFMYLMLSYPLIYYITHVSNRYRHPIEPFILIIGVYGITVLYDNLWVFIKKSLRKEI